MKHYSLFLLVFGLSAQITVIAQTPPAQVASPIQIESVRVEPATLPGSSLRWAKLIAEFSTTEPWLDGVVFSATALLGEGESARLVTGNVRYSNIPKGRHSAILYLSPRAAARFGSPELVQFTAFHRDMEASQMTWKNPSAGSLPENWQSLNVYPNVLVNVTRTPWILVDYDKTPDVAGN
ncbi:MAG: hypothetical protein Fur0032_10620 [Terrimicrobiaceae bacterium]